MILVFEQQSANRDTDDKLTHAADFQNHTISRILQHVDGFTEWLPSQTPIVYGHYSVPYVDGSRSMDSSYNLNVSMKQITGLFIVNKMISTLTKKLIYLVKLTNIASNQCLDE